MTQPLRLDPRPFQLHFLSSTDLLNLGTSAFYTLLSCANETMGVKKDLKSNTVLIF